jgi:mediator of RNA polymerase II transcription subunit 10
MVELVMRYNQQLKGRSEAFASFRDILGQQMMVGIPEIKDDVKRVVEASGGRVE